jgi:hypothetical protein
VGETIVPKQIAIVFDGLTVVAELNDSPCARGIFEALPIEAQVNTWGEEIYFSIGLAQELTGAARSEMAVGEIAYWPAGQAFCIFFGRTPASSPGGPPRAASDVEPLGRIVGDTEPLKGITDGQKVVLSAGA